MDKLLIRGGQRLTGEIAIAGAKNAALPELCAALLVAEPVTLANVPSLQDVATMTKLLRHLGVVVERSPSDPDRMTFDASRLTLPATRGCQASGGGSVMMMAGGRGGGSFGPAGPFGGRERLHRQRVDLLAHSIAQCRIHPLVAPDARQAVELGRHDGGEEMAAVALHLEVGARQSLRDVALDVGGGRVAHKARDST